MLGKLEYQRGNFDAALQVFQRIDIQTLSLKIAKAITEGRRLLKPCSKSDVVHVGVMSLHSMSLLLQAILLKAKSLEKLSRIKEILKVRTIHDLTSSANAEGQKYSGLIVSTIASSNNGKDEDMAKTCMAVVSPATFVATQCAEATEAMGAKRKYLASVIIFAVNV
ncbi:hypothetical protein FXO38_19595 [Capsicum annuum]|nr:hypothetical protein FXO38_19595 [Capsicum annuum]